MSGGSFNYLCHKEGADLVAYQGESDLEDMIKALSALGYAEDAAKESMAVLAEVRSARVRLDVMIERLGPVWKAMEWWQSMDYGEKDFQDVLAKYRVQEVP